MAQKAMTFTLELTRQEALLGGKSNRPQRRISFITKHLFFACSVKIFDQQLPPPPPPQPHRHTRRSLTLYNTFPTFKDSGKEAF